MMVTRQPLRRPALLDSCIRFMVIASLLATLRASGALAATRTAFEYKVATWNMQGGSSGRDNKWAQVQGMMKDFKLDVLALQESGSEPNSARMLINGLPDISELPSTELAGMRKVSESLRDVNIFSWNLGTTSRPENVFIYQFDMSTRLNIAIVSRYPADEILVLPPNPPQSRTRRPVLGVRVGQSAFFNIHAAAIGGGNEAPEQVLKIENAMRTYDLVSSWIILGDFNRSPNSISSALTPTNNYFTRRIVYDETQTATQQSGNILDYAIIGSDNYILPSRILMRARITNIRSDHSAVAISPA